MILRVPQGYTRLATGSWDAVARDTVVPALREALSSSTLYEFAERQPERRAYAGRRPAYAIMLGNTRVVVRHSHHGGWLAPLTRDVFLTPTRAPYELLASLLLAHAGVPTPPVLAFVLYRVAPLLRRADVATAEVAGDDLAAVLTRQPSDAPASWMLPVSELLKGLTRAGAWHPDLNVKNILVSTDPTGAPRAFVLDVDRVRFHPPEDPNVRSANFNRLVRSLRTWSDRAAMVLDDRLLGQLRELAFGS